MKFISSCLIPIGVALLVSVATNHAALVLTPDPVQSSPGLAGREMGGAINDGFTCDPLTPTAPLADQTSGSWDAGLPEQITRFSGANNVPYYGCPTATAGTEADRFLISGPDQVFTIMELRANGVVPVPEPTNVALGVFGVVVVMFGIGRRLCARAHQNPATRSPWESS